MDASGSISIGDFVGAKAVVSQSALLLSAEGSDTRSAALAFSTTPDVAFGLTPLWPRDSSLLSLISGMPYLGARSWTGAGIGGITDSVLDLDGSTGLVVNPTVVVVFTDGQAQDTDVLVVEVPRLKATGAVVVAVGLGAANQVELNYIASDPSLVFSLDSFVSVLSRPFLYGLRAQAASTSAARRRRSDVPVTTQAPAVGGEVVGEVVAHSVGGVAVVAASRAAVRDAVNLGESASADEAIVLAVAVPTAVFLDDSGSEAVVSVSEASVAESSSIAAYADQSGLADAPVFVSLHASGLGQGREAAHARVPLRAIEESALRAVTVSSFELRALDGSGSGSRVQLVLWLTEETLLPVDASLTLAVDGPVLVRVREHVGTADSADLQGLASTVFSLHGAFAVAASDDVSGSDAVLGSVLVAELPEDSLFLATLGSDGERLVSLLLPASGSDRLRKDVGRQGAQQDGSKAGGEGEDEMVMGAGVDAEVLGKRNAPSVAQAQRHSRVWTVISVAVAIGMYAVCVTTVLCVRVGVWVCGCGCVDVWMCV